MIKLSNLSTFNVDIAKGRGIIYFTATWCPPCQFVKPIFKKLSEDSELKDYGFIMIDIDQNQELAANNEVASIPTFYTYDDGKLSNKHVGIMSEEKMRSYIKSK